MADASDGGTPLAAAIDPTWDELTRGNNEPAIVEYATLIHDAAEHLLSVVNDILDISKIQSGKYTLDAREVNVGDILAASVASFQMMELHPIPHLADW